MTIVATIQRALGLNGCTLALADLPAKLRSPADLTFDVVLYGGHRELRVRELTVCLEEERLIYLDPARGEFGYWATVVRSRIPLPRLALSAHTRVRLPVTLPLPELEPTTPLRRYRLLVAAEVPGFNPRASRLVAIDEPAPRPGVTAW